MSTATAPGVRIDPVEREPPNPLGRSPLIRDHRRQWRECLYVYPVISRRSKGLSIGVNLSPGMQCTFGCVYCQVDRRTPRGLDRVDLHTLRAELQAVCGEAASGRIWQTERFRQTPPDLRRINDIAFSGDGEPTSLPEFDQAIQIAADVRNLFNRNTNANTKAAFGPALADVKIVVITNATLLRSPQLERALPILDANNGEIWAKLDAGTEERFREINRPAAGVTLAGVLDGIIHVARGRGVVIQTLMMRLRGVLPTDADTRAYVDRLREISRAGGHIKLVQLHTVARPPAEGYVAALTAGELDEVAARVRQSLPGTPVAVFPGAG